MYHNHVGELVIVMADQKNEKLAEVALQSLAAVSRADQAISPDDRSVHRNWRESALILA